MIAFVEDVHDLDFTEPVGVVVGDDVGADFRHFDIVPERDWRLLVTLGLIEPDDPDRETINELRRDRVRGYCCRHDGGVLSVVIEVLGSKAETEIVLVHELVHALHRQRFADLSYGVNPDVEIPLPAVSAIEGTAQLVALAWMRTLAPDVQAAVEPELLIVDDEFALETGATAAWLFNFAYFTAPALAETVYERRGPAGLTELLTRIPTTTEQVLFPDRWLSGEEADPVDPIPVRPGVRTLGDGRIGVALLDRLINDLELLSGWAGDTYVLYLEPDGRRCLDAVVRMDTAAGAERFAAALLARTDFAIEATGGAVEPEVALSTCRAQPSA